MNILEKHSPSGTHPPPPPPTLPSAATTNQTTASNNGSTNGGSRTPTPTTVIGPPNPHPSSSAPPSAGSSAADCLIANSQLIPGPSSVSSSSAPHTPLDGVPGSGSGAVTCSAATAAELATRANVSTPSSVFNNSAPSTPMPCPSVGSDVTSPALGGPPLPGDYGGPSAPSNMSPFANNSNCSANNNNNQQTTNMLPSPLGVHGGQSSCSDNSMMKVATTTTPAATSTTNNNKPMMPGGNGSTNGPAPTAAANNKKHCNNNRNNNGPQQQQQPPPPVNSAPGPGQYMSNNPGSAGPVSCSGPGGHPATPDKPTQINYNQMHPNGNNGMTCGMQNGLPPNGAISPFDVDCKMFPTEFSPSLPADAPPIAGRIGPMGCASPMMNAPAGPNKIQCNTAPNARMPQQPPPPHSMKAGAIEGGAAGGGGTAAAQYMQQHQNQVFVFNTALANSAAEAVEQGHYPSIIHFHMNQPHTKKFMDKHSIKSQNFNRPQNNNHLWAMGNIRQPRMRGPAPANGALPPPVRTGNFANSCFAAPYNQHNPPGPGPGGGTAPGSWNPNPGWPGAPNEMKMNCGNNSMRQCGPQQYNNFNSPTYPPPPPPPPMGCNDSNQDENLTPQQKQNRENKLAFLHNLHQKFLQNEMLEPSAGAGPGPGGVNTGSSNNRLPPPPSNEFVGMDPIANHQSALYPEHSSMAIKQENDQMNPSDMNFSGGFCPNPAMMNNHPNNNDQWLKSGGAPPPPGFPIEESKPFGSGGPGTASTTGGGGRRKGSQQNASHQSPQASLGNSPGMSLSPGGGRVPPPPYNQGMRSMPSPHPGSPATMASPRAPPPTDVGRPALINSPKSSSSQARTNTSPGSKKAKQQQVGIDAAELGMLQPFPKTGEPALMPVPSPKQIEYINTFDGQELTIQKQPNAHFQESNDLMGSTSDLTTLNSNDLFGTDQFGQPMCPSGGPPPMNDASGGGIGMCQGNHPQANQARFSQPCSFDSRYPPDNMRFNGMESSYGHRGPPPFNEANMRFGNCDMKPGARMPPPNDMGLAPPPFASSNSMCDMNFGPPMPPEGGFPNGPSNPPGNHLGFNEPDGANPISSTHLQNLQKMAPPFDMAPTGAGPLPPPSTAKANSGGGNPKAGRMPPGSYDQGPPPPFGAAPPCSDMNDSNSYGTPSGINYAGSFSGSPQMPSGMMGPGNDAYGMSSGSFSPMPPPSSLMDQGSQQQGGGAPMMAPGSQGGNGFPPRLPPPQQQQQPPPPPNARPMNASNTHGPRYSSPNIQVRPDAPNTIQYLPSRPQGPSTPPNRPPNLDFLQQSLSMNSGGGAGNKPAGQPNTYYPNSNRAPNMNFGPRGPMARPPAPPPPPGPPNQAPNTGPMCPGNMANGPNQMAPPNRTPGPPPGPGGNGANSNNKSVGPLLHPADSFNFNKPSFDSLPSTSDPNYAAQYHSFQQQLYATSNQTMRPAGRRPFNSNAAAGSPANQPAGRKSN